MISSLFVAAILQSSDAPPAVSRADAYLASAPGLSVDFTVSQADKPTKGLGSMVVMRPDRQWFTCVWDDESIEYRYSRSGALLIRHDWKAYEEYPPTPMLMVPRKNFLGSAAIAPPPFIYSASITGFVSGAVWKPGGSATVGGVECNVVTAEAGLATPFPGVHTAWIDATGRIKKWRRKYESNAGAIDVTYDFQSYEVTSEPGKARFQPDLPLGYMPIRIPRPLTNTLQVDFDAVYGKWADARTGKIIDFEEWSKKNPIALVFTDPESEICQKIEPFLVTFRRRLKPYNVAVVEVVLGPKSPTLSERDKDRTVVWDKYGEIERLYGVPGTPYFLMSDTKGLLVRGWQGYRKSDENKIVENFVSQFKKS